ncbi:S-adenosyl-L-methionine-dependent methyltransferase [Immersiella caudata]|uniref:S-adenosyl-L-methionine-dependent methyltransferase n=1 Tax=Immersiella caudata TaxID=314043 RepID=A0AA39TYA7_9PEZI|nr:S-adenosyl-L-methionine-dependent methyltransferase [Immersiella caudata]
MTGGKETTFRAFTSQQGSDYAQYRHDYHPRLYNAVIDHHKATGGQFDALLDVGCGPGIAVRSLAPLFEYATAIDPSAGMIESALAIDNPSAKSGPIRFAVSSAEFLGADLSPPIPDASIDLLTAATAAHWFDMSKFWPRAAEVVKPGGTVAIWCAVGICISPTTANHERVQAAIDNFDVLLEDYIVAGNRISRSEYVDLPLPWTVEPPVSEFDRDSFVRKEWGQREGLEPGEEFYNVTTAGLGMLEKVMGTSSPVIRWREANPEKAGTEEDVVKMTRREIEEAFRDAGVEKGKEDLRAGVKGVLLLAKRK